MELYRVLLVDDEEDIREGISRKMDWLGLGFSLVGEAANGQDALELAESLRPDVILTDIKMPFMDGLELCRILTDRLPAARFVVFSGFDAFEYAKQAIQMNVVEYILKPINADELSAVLRRLKDQLDRERAERRNVELLRSRYTENLPVLREVLRQSAGRAHRAGNGAGAGGASGHRPSGRGMGGGPCLHRQRPERRPVHIVRPKAAGGIPDGGSVPPHPV